jgi:hypothetical protein
MELGELERSTKEGGQLLLLPSSTAVVVNSAQPLELDDPMFGSTVLRNLRVGAQYEYYYGAFSDNKEFTANLVLNIATADLQMQNLSIDNNLDAIKRNLTTMQKSLSIHFRKKPPLQFCVHNATDSDRAVCYLRGHGENRDVFVKWAANDEARAIAKELRDSCTTPNRAVSIYHSTIDSVLDKEGVVESITEVFPSNLPQDFYDHLYKACVGA